MSFINPATNTLGNPTILAVTHTLDLGNGVPLSAPQREALTTSWDLIVGHCTETPAPFEVFKVQVRYGEPQVVHTFAVSTFSLYVVGMLPPAGGDKRFPALEYGGEVPQGPLNYEALVTACNTVASAPPPTAINETKNFRWVCFLVSEAARQKTAREAVLAALTNPTAGSALVEYKNHLPVINNWKHIAKSDQRLGPQAVNRMITRDDMQRYFEAHPLDELDAGLARSIGAAK